MWKSILAIAIGAILGFLSLRGSVHHTFEMLSHIHPGILIAGFLGGCFIGVVASLCVSKSHTK
jgi:fluoride ion exporter CrcB/FEX